MDTKVCENNPNIELIRQAIKEDLPLLRMLTTNSKSEK